MSPTRNLPQISMRILRLSGVIWLLEKTFVIFPVQGFSRNLRKEVVKMDKIYFYDLGVRNVLIDNLKALKDRNDTGQLWENFLVVERMKYSRQTAKRPQSWVTAYPQAEFLAVNRDNYLQFIL